MLSSRQRGTYLTINSDGKFVQRVPDTTEGATPRINKEGKQVFEVFYDTLESKLTNVKTKVGPYGKNWEFYFQDGEETCILQLGYTNSYAKALLKMLPNIDLSKPFKLSPSSKMVEGKKQTALFANQGDTPIKHAYTKDAPNGLPPMKQIKVKGVVTWDDTEMVDWLQTMVNTDILPKLGQSPDAVEPSLDDIDTKAKDEETPF